MTERSKLTTPVLAAAVATGLLLSSTPAEAGSLGRGFMHGLIGGVALGALATAAQANQQGETFYAAVEEVPDDVRYLNVVRVRPAPRVTAAPPPIRTARPSAVAPRRPPVARPVSANLERCREAITASSRPYGSTTVRVARAGEEHRLGGEVVAPLNATIAYTQRGQRQVRQARVSCHLSPKGEVVAFR